MSQIADGGKAMEQALKDTDGNSGWVFIVIKIALLLMNVLLSLVSILVPRLVFELLLSDRH